MKNHSTAGILLGVLAYGLFMLHDACIKALVVADIPVWQVLFARSASVMAICLAIGRARLIQRLIDTPLKRPLAFRAGVNLTAWLCFYSAADTLPMGQWLCLYFAAPLMVTVMARQILKETVTRGRWIALSIGFVGVLCASDPMGIRPSLAVLLVVIAAALWGYGIILMRQIARQEPALLQMLTSNGVFTVATGLACLIHWRQPDTGQVVLLGAVALLGGMAQFLVYEAARLIPASVMATVEYSALPWSFILGYAVWRDIPEPPIVLGAALIVGAGVLLVWSERRKVG